MRIISFNAIYISYYFKNSILSGISLCGSAYHVLSLLKDKYDVLYLGNVDNYVRKMIDVNYLNTVCEFNNKVFINDKKVTYSCPYCNRNKNKEININYNVIKDSIKDDDVIVLDDINQDTLNVIRSINNKIFLILDSLNEIRKYSLDELISIFKDKFVSIILDVSVYHYLRDKFNVDSYDLYELFNPNILIIFRGKCGADFIFLDNIIEKEIEDKIDEIDKRGGISAFSSVFIDYFINNQVIDEKIISALFIKANLMYIKNVYKLGLNKLYKIDKYDECICNNFIIKE